MKKTIFLVMCVAMLGLPSCAQKKNAAPEKKETAAAQPAANAGYTVKTLPTAITSNILWATWCPPCRRAMTVIDSIKPGYIEKGVKFVYITGETSPEKNWNDMIPNIHGDHYRLTNAQWETLMREQGIPGIPVYKVINKDGSTAFSNFTMGGYPGNEVIKPILDEALKK